MRSALLSTVSHMGWRRWAITPVIGVSNQNCEYGWPHLRVVKGYG